MKQFRIEDNSFRKKEEFSQVQGIVKCVADKTLLQLEKEGIFVFPEQLSEAEDISDEQGILQTVNDTYRTGNVMGFLGLKDERLIISSRFCKGDSDYFFQYLIEKVMGFPNLTTLETDAAEDNRLYSLLLFLFPRYLKAAMRKGIFKTYVRNEYNDTNPRGNIEIGRFVKEDVPFVGNIAYSMREQAYDNYLLELIRHTIEYIKKKPYGHKILARVKEEEREIIAITQNYKPGDKRKIIELNRKNVVRHAYYHEYRSLQRLCILILQNREHQIGTGNNHVYGVLFDGAWLWEEYVNTLLKDKFYHPKNKLKQGREWLFKGGIGEVFPDFIGKNRENRLIVDAKYKPMANIRGKDYLQILAYMFRFDSKQGYLIYPEVNEEEHVCPLYLNEGLTCEKSVVPRNDTFIVKYGIVIPNDSETYATFVLRMQKTERIIKDCGNMAYN